MQKDPLNLDESKSMELFLGITGLPGSGKETVAKLMTSELKKRSIHVIHRSLSEAIDAELRRRSLPPYRVYQRTVANEFREKLGFGVWAQRIASEIRETLEYGDWDKVLVIFDGIRNTGEVDFLEKLWGSRFVLLAVDASREVIEKNLRKRSASKDASVLADSTSDLMTPLLTPELGVGEPGHGVDVPACMALADWTIENKEWDESLIPLRDKVRQFINEFILPLYS